SAGTLALGTANERLADTSTLVVSGGTFDLGGFSETVAGVQLTGGTIQNGTLISTAAFDLRSGAVSAILDGAVGLNKTTTDTVTLTGNNSYTGATAVSAGTLVASHASALGTTAGITTVSSGATLEINNVNIGTEALNLAGSGASGVGALVGTGAGAAAGGVITLSATTSVGGTGALALGGAIGDGGNAFGLTKVGSGTITLSGTSTYTGDTTVNVGTLALGANNALASTGALVVDGGTFGIASFDNSFASVSLRSGSITGSTGVLTSAATYDMRAGSASAILAGGAGLSKTTAGTVTLSGNNTYAGATTVSAGTLALGTANERLADTSTLVVSGGTFDLGG
ncbi:MAG: autotransporter-associated beta strand repeat-containing protein, partial [Rubrivivax sp.]|nr:autotransporter-associated beta strand repeat-containing protein [Rubrivivax sp.]